MNDLKIVDKFLPDSKKSTGKETSHELAEMLGWNDCLLEINKRLVDNMLNQMKGNYERPKI